MKNAKFLRPSLRQLVGILFALSPSLGHANSTTCYAKQNCDKLNDRVNEEYAAGLYLTRLQDSLSGTGRQLAETSCPAAERFEYVRRCYLKITETRCLKAAKTAAGENAAKAVEAQLQCKGARDVVQSTTTDGEVGQDGVAGSEPASAGAESEAPEAGDVEGEPSATAGEDKPERFSGVKDFLSENSGVLGALAGGALGYLGANFLKGDDSKKDETSPILPNGRVDCSHKDGYRFGDCESYFTKMCQATVLQGSSMAQSETTASGCASFEKMYCTMGDTEAVELTYELPNSARMNYVMLGSGAGVGEKFCQVTAAARFCQSQGEGSDCPSCLMLSSMSSATCQENPSACLAENSQAQLFAARSKPACMSDPMFSDPAFANLLNESSEEFSEGVPVTILPQNVASATSRGPASDLAGKHGWALSSMSSKAIQGVCAKRQLNNCR